MEDWFLHRNKYVLTYTNETSLYFNLKIVLSCVRFFTVVFNIPGVEVLGYLSETVHLNE